MRNELRLMERVRQGTVGAVKKSEFDRDRFIDSVTRNIKNILNHRQGSCSTCPEYGFPDFENLEQAQDFEGTALRVSKAIASVIDLYEPGLKGVKVTPVDNGDSPTSLEFEINATLNVKTRHRKVKFKTFKTFQGGVQVKS